MIPILGRAPLTGLRKDVSDGVKRAVKALMVQGLSDQLLHAEIVAAGQFNFRHAFVKDMGASFGNSRGACDELADVVFRFFQGQWQQKYPNLSPEQFLDTVFIRAAPTEAEIEDGWELEIASDERTLNQYYEGSARTRKGSDFGARTTPLKLVQH